MAGKIKIPLGSPVIIDTNKSKYNLNNKLNKEIALMPEGIVLEYGNDLSGQYIIVKLRSNIKIKVCENELSECTRNYYSGKASPFNLLKNIKYFVINDISLTGNKKLKYLLNPLSFLKWLVYTIKDVF